jgi:hypothetical protein
MPMRPFFFFGLAVDFTVENRFAARLPEGANRML